MNVNQLLKRARKFKPKEISQASGLSRSLIHNYLHSVYGDPKISTLQKLERGIQKLEGETKVKSSSRK